MIILQVRPEKNNTTTYKDRTGTVCFESVLTETKRGHTEIGCKNTIVVDVAILRYIYPCVRSTLVPAVSGKILALVTVLPGNLQSNNSRK